MICHDGFLCMAPISPSSFFLGLFRRSSCAKTLMLASSERPLPRLGPLSSLQTCNDTSTTACSGRMRGIRFTTEAVLLKQTVKHQGFLYYSNGWLLVNQTHSHVCDADGFIRMVKHQDETLTILMLVYWKWDTDDGEVPSP